MIPEQNGDPVVESEEARGGGRVPGTQRRRFLGSLTLTPLPPKDTAQGHACPCGWRGL